MCIPEPEDIGTLITDEMLAHFPGYQNPFWYEKKNKKMYDLRENKNKEVPSHPGTQPDIEVRWYYGESLVEQARVARLSKMCGRQPHGAVL